MVLVSVSMTLRFSCAESDGLVNTALGVTALEC